MRISILFILFYFIFWPRCAACGIIVPRPGIEPGPSAVKARSPNHWTPGEFLKHPHFILFFLALFSFFFFLAGLGLHCYAWAFLSLWSAGATLRCGAQASQCGGFSCCRARALGVWASVVAACRLSSCGARA